MTPGFWRAHLDLGILAADAGDNEKALREMQLAANQQPNEVNIPMRLGRVLKAMGKTAEARAEFDKANNLPHAVDEDLIEKMKPKTAAAPQ